MSVDAGMAELMDRLHTVSGPGVEVTAGLDVQVGRLCSLMERQLAEERVMAESITIVDLAPLDFQVTAGQPRFKGYRASGRTCPRKRASGGSSPACRWRG